MGNPHCPNGYDEIYFKVSRNIWRGSAQQSIEGHQKAKKKNKKNTLIVWRVPEDEKNCGGKLSDIVRLKMY